MASSGSDEEYQDSPSHSDRFRRLRKRRRLEILGDELSRDILLAESGETDCGGVMTRSLTRNEVVDAVQHLGQVHTAPHALVARKLKSRRETPRSEGESSVKSDANVQLIDIDPQACSSENLETMDALSQLRTTPYRCSFLSRVSGCTERQAAPILLSMDWSSSVPWLELMSDIRQHHALSHGLEMEEVSKAPIRYETLQAHHLAQVHDLLSRTFWFGINVADSLDYFPERCTIVAMYKQLVVGITIMSSPQEAYITYLAVRAGWENAKIATCMLHHLITRNPHTDITLHVSASNPAMLLYNRFGFKAEEFIAGFYEHYLDPLSRLSRNAFKLRLRQQ